MDIPIDLKKLSLIFNWLERSVFYKPALLCLFLREPNGYYAKAKPEI
jgi:hypothetical protein